MLDFNFNKFVERKEDLYSLKSTQLITFRDNFNKGICSSTCISYLLTLFYIHPHFIFNIACYLFG